RLLLADLLLLLLDLLLLRLLFTRRLLLAIRLAPLIACCLLIHLVLLLLTRGLLLATLRRSLVLGPHHGPMVLRLSVVRPVPVLANPVGMVGGNPVRVLVVPPLAVMPVVLGVVGAVLVKPLRIPRYPIRVIGVEEVRIVLMPPVGILPVAAAVVVAIFGEPERVHHGPFRMIGVEPHDVVLMPPSRAVPDVIIVVRAPSGFSRSSVVAWAGIAGTVLRERRCCDRERHNRAKQGNHISQFVFHQFHSHRRQYRETGVVPYGPLQALFPVDLRWSSETWSKASGKATVGLDQGRTRFLYQFQLTGYYI